MRILLSLLIAFLLLLIARAYNLLQSSKVRSKLGQHPIVGSPSRLAPRFLLNLMFAVSGAEVLNHGYNKFKKRSFQLIRNDRCVVILPLSVIDELSALPTSIATPHDALENDLLGAYTSLDIILESRLHHSIIQRKLTPRLTGLTPDLEIELRAAFDEYFPECGNNWATIQPFRLFGKIAARLSARAMVGPIVCRDPLWLEISVEYTENLFKTIVILRMFPTWTHPFLSRLLPSYWFGQKYIRAAKLLLVPILTRLIHKNDEGSSRPDENKEDQNVLAWLADMATKGDRNPETLAHVEVLLALASVHTTLLRIVNVLYDLTDNPEYFSQLRGEIRNVSDGGWCESSYSRLHKLDSVLRESQRLSPPTFLGLKRLFKKSHTFSNGLHIPHGTYVALPIMAIENDPEHTSNPETFDGLRSYRLRQRENDSNEILESDHQFSSIGRTVLNFGYGRAACPGRYFASLMIKMIFVKILTEYDFKFLPGTTRPKNYTIHEFLFPWPWDKILVRKREDQCPF